MSRCTIPLVAAALLLAGFASAHVTPAPREFEAGSYGAVALRISHGCDGSPTTRVVLDVPESLASVRPRQMSDYNITVEVGPYATPTVLHGANVTEGVRRITWEGELPDEYFQVFEVSFKLRDMAELDLEEFEMPVDGWRPVFLPTTQYCVNGESLAWVDPDPESEYPAPTIYVNEEGVSSHGH